MPLLNELSALIPVTLESTRGILVVAICLSVLVSYTWKFSILTTKTWAENERGSV